MGAARARSSRPAARRPLLRARPCWRGSVTVLSGGSIGVLFTIAIHPSVMVAVIEARGLIKRYGETVALNDVSLEVPAGALYGLLGPNGSGKSTTIRMLSGQTRPTAGTATVLGVNAAADPVGVRRRIGIIPEQETPPSFLTAEEYLRFVGSVRSLEEADEAADWWFEFLDFGDKRDVLCKDLSRGTRQKLMFAQAFLHRPALALIDEPLVNFDPIVQHQVKEFLVDYVRQGNTIFLSTHILEVAEEVCTGYAILHRGRLLHTGTPDDLRETGRHLPEVFLGLVGRDPAHA
jgi:ABC-2 type transport system ATP-binding protein